jgi:DNA invertase Pin-like site-specific DNA recombinase
VRPTLRCAIYTRVSTEHGLEQEFNSLDNQREAAEAYVKSQAHEGWKLHPGRYDDGGFSGGSMDRPALQKLLQEVRQRRIDVIVVYKVDRLTRSLADFAKLVELFDANGVSFVSVTQAFNTTTSMGRLTLNVLLSFAQFEREVTGERIRDKIAASKKKGMWMGGVVPLGYRVEARALHVVEEHAVLIRMLFDRYRELGSVARLKLELDDRCIRVPERIDGAGRRCGGASFSRGHLYAILGNPIYAGRLSHKGRTYPGQHAGIISDAVWEEVQQGLSARTRTKANRSAVSSHLLAGRIQDDAGRPLSPSHAQKGARRYRYYVSQAVLQGEKPSGIRRTAAPEIEAAVVSVLRSSTTSSLLDDAELVSTKLEKVVVHPDRLVLHLTGRDTPIEHPWSQPATRRRREIVLPPGRNDDPRPMKPEDRARILKAIATGRAWMDELLSARAAGPDAIASRESLSERSVRMTLSLAYLSPSIVQAIIAGRLPRGIGIRDLAELPNAWAAQERALGM